MWLWVCVFHATPNNYYNVMMRLTMNKTTNINCELLSFTSTGCAIPTPHTRNFGGVRILLVF